MAKNRDAKRVIILDGRIKNSPDNGNGAENGELSAFGDIVSDESAQAGNTSFDIMAEEGDNDKYAGKSGKSVSHTSVKKTGRSKKARKRMHLLVLIISTVILAITAAGAVRGINNNYHTPIRIYEEYLNKPEYTGEELSEALGNHVAQKQLKRLRELLGSKEDYRASLNASLLHSREVYRNNCETYGDDFRYTISVDGVKKLDSIQVAALRTELNGILSDISSSSLVTTGDPELSRAVLDVTSAFKDPGITAGYYVYCTQRVTGNTSEGSAEDIHDYHTFIVVKLDGRWIMWDKIYDILKMQY